jgi:hypothetical protein
MRTFTLVYLVKQEVIGKTAFATKEEQLSIGMINYIINYSRGSVIKEEAQ